MAGKGTYTALQALKPIETDFGKIARDEEALQFKYREEKRAIKAKEDADKEKIAFNPLGDASTGVESLDDALYKGIRDMNVIRHQDWLKARNNPAYAKSDEYLAKTANRANYAKNLKIFTDKYSEYAKNVVAMGGDLSGWNDDAMKEVNAFFNEEKVMFGENKYGEPTAMVAVINPETGEIEKNEDGTQKYTETSLAKVLKGTGIYDLVPKVDVIESVKSIGDILGADLKDVKNGWTITSSQLWENKEAGARELVKSELGSVRNPTALAKRMWADEMGMKKEDWDETAYTEVENALLKKVKATYDEKIEVAYNYAGENALASRTAKENENVVVPVVTPDSNTGQPLVTKIPGLEDGKQGYSISFGKGIQTFKAEGASEIINNIWVTEDGQMFATKLKSVREGGEPTPGETPTLAEIISGSAKGWKTEEVTQKVSETEFTNLAKNPNVKREDGGNFKDGKELKTYLKEQYDKMPKKTAGSFNKKEATKGGASKFNPTN